MEEKLYLLAKEVLKNAYAPHSEFRVGAALLCKEGEIFTGVNVENSSYGATICAERSAACAAVSAGFREFSAIAVATDEGEAVPCGICRQFLYEFSPGMEVITSQDDKNLKVRPLSSLLPEGFRL